MEVEKLFGEIESILRGNAMTAGWSYAIPDTPWITITIAVGGRSLVLRSSHTLLEQDPKLVATSQGIVARGNATRDAVLAKQPDEFRRGRQAFDDILRLLKDYLNAEVLVSQP